MSAQLVWNVNGIRVFGTVSVRWVENAEPWITGLGTIDVLGENAVFSWQAKAMPLGYFVEISTESGLRGSYQGPTFNLPLEVASAARRIL